MASIRSPVSIGTQRPKSHANVCVGSETKRAERCTARLSKSPTDRRTNGDDPCSRVSAGYIVQSVRSISRSH